MALPLSDIEEYAVRKTIDAGFSVPTKADLCRVIYTFDYTDSVVENYLEEKRDTESQQDYEGLLDLIELIKNEAL